MQYITPLFLKKTLKKHDIKQKDFAKKIGVTPVTISRWISGVYPIPLSTQLLILIISDLSTEKVHRYLYETKL